MYNDFSFTKDRIPQYLQWVKTGGDLDCYVDYDVITGNIPKESIAMLIEPRSIQPNVYEYIEDYGNKFQYVFTHDSILLNKLDNAKLILFGGVYGLYNVPKIKNISMVSSNKEMCELHKIRTDLAIRLEDYEQVDCMGTYNGGPFVSTEKIYGPYKYSIVIENYKDDDWFTEKICNAFASRTVPIYYGARNIGKYFNSLGIIQLNDPYEAINVVEHLDCDKDYLNRLPGIIANYELVKRFYCFEDWFYTEYQELLEGVINGDQN